MRKTSMAIEQQVVNRIALGESYSSIAAELGVAVPTIKKIRKRNEDRLALLKAEVAKSQQLHASEMLSRSTRLLKERLNRAEAEQAQLDELSEKYRVGAITGAEYRQRKRGLKGATINELIAVHKLAIRQIAKS